MLLKRPAASAVLSGSCLADAVASDSSDHAKLWTGSQDEVATKYDLIRMGPAIVRVLLEAQGRYSRKRRREHASEHSTGEENKIRIWAKLFDINLGKQVADSDSNTKWWHKSKRELIDEIVAAVEHAQ